MTLVWTSWYACVLFVVMLGCSSLISVAPGGEKSAGVLMGALLTLAAGSGVLAVYLRRRLRTKSGSFIFRSKAVSGICVGIAAFLTLIFILGVVG